MALPQTTVRSPTRPANPVSGGHYIPIAGGQWRLIHAVGPGKWAPGPRTTPLPGRTPSRPAGGGAANPYANPIYDPSQQLSGKSLYRAVQALTNATYDPLIKGYQTQLQQSQAHSQAVRDQTAQAYQNLAQYAQDAATNTQNAYGTLASGMQGVGQQTQSALDQFLQRAENPAGQAVGTSPPGAVDQLAQNIAAAKANAAQTAQADQAYAQTVGALETARAGQTPGILASAATQKLGDLANAGLLAEQPIQTNLTNARQKKAEAFSTNLMAARAAERNYAIAQGGLDVRQQAAKTSAATAAFNTDPNAPGSPAQQRVAQQMESDRTYQLNLKRYGLAVAKDQYQRDHGLGPYKVTSSSGGGGGGGGGGAPKPLSIASQNVIKNRLYGLQKIIKEDINTYHHGRFNATTLGYAWHDIASGRVNGSEFGVQMLNAAYNSLLNGLTPGDVRALRNMGVVNLGGLRIQGQTHLPPGSNTPGAS